MNNTSIKQYRHRKFRDLGKKNNLISYLAIDNQISYLSPLVLEIQTY